MCIVYAQNDNPLVRTRSENNIILKEKKINVKLIVSYGKFRSYFSCTVKAFLSAILNAFVFFLCSFRRKQLNEISFMPIPMISVIK